MLFAFVTHNESKSEQDMTPTIILSCRDVTIVSPLATAPWEKSEPRNGRKDSAEREEDGEEREEILLRVG